MRKMNPLPIVWGVFTLILLLQSDGLNHGLTHGWYRLSPFLLIAITALSILALYRDGRHLTLLASYRKTAIIPFLFLSCMTTVILFGKSLLFDEDGLWLDLHRAPLFCLLFLSCSIYNLFTCHLIGHWQKKIKSTARTRNHAAKYEHLHIVGFFFLQLTILSLYLIAYNPGSIGLDTYNQLAQQYGLVKYSTWHPLASTLLMKGLLFFWDHFLILTLFQLFFFSIVSSVFLGSFLRRGAPLPLLYALAFLLPLLPNHGVSMTTIVKDTLFVIALLWLTSTVYTCVEDKHAFSKRWVAFSYAGGMAAVALLRFNGLLAFLAMLLFFSPYLLHRSETRPEKGSVIVATTASVIIVILFNSIIPTALQADKNPSGTKLRTMYNGFAALYVADKENVLNTAEQAKIEAIAGPEEMRKLYDPYTADPFMRQVPGFIDQLSQMNTGTALQLYIKSFLHAPDVILGDKLNLSVLLWSATPDTHSYNNAFTTNNIPPDPVLNHYDIRPYHIQRHHNLLTDTFDAILYPSINNSGIIAALLWRSGFSLILIACALYVAWLRRSENVWLFLPILANVVGVFLTMPAQEFRYAHGLLLLCPYLLLAVVLTDEPNTAKTPSTKGNGKSSNVNGTLH